MAHSNEERKIALAEYIQGNELARHYDAVAWVVGSIFFPVSLGLLALSYTEPVLKYSPWSLFPLCIASVSIFGIWLCLDTRYSFYCHIVFGRLQEIEKKYGMDIHFRIHRVDSARPWKVVRRARFWVRIMIVPLIASWLIRILLWFIVQH